MEEFKDSISETDLDQFIKIVNELTGMDINDKRHNLLLKLPKFIKDMNFNSFSEFLSRVRVNKDLRQKTLNFVTIGETYFLRELPQLQEIVFHAKSLDRRVSILSAPCSSGEEVYSLAILAAQNFIKEMYILGVDINSDVIEKAKRGKYKGRTLNHISSDQKTRFFMKEDEDYYTIDKNKICSCRFELHNVFESNFLRLSKFDIILSRNMLIYFDYDSKLKVLENFHKILADDGRLYVGTADLIPDNIFFKKVFSSKGTYYEKL